eukprot:CAMPEP_0177758724 /NCGR_PEP_ID=MMETSP0491_2-20121128/4343_1 /TAXON_ID=63592 /ORGANISM="Tetraselmis chuii, Strain PLY429" /LENGTH=148 /DNA_ID=CAMNT_0019274489 /DNA_START=1786 /DNA_END=2229 /DNA_ORIENTATION=-
MKQDAPSLKLITIAAAAVVLHSNSTAALPRDVLAPPLHRRATRRPLIPEVLTHQRLHIVIATAHDDGKLPSAGYLRNDRHRKVSELQRCELHGIRREEAHQVVGHPGLLLRCGFVGGDVEAGVHLQRVGVHALAPKPAGQVDRKFGLA